MSTLHNGNCAKLTTYACGGTPPHENMSTRASYANTQKSWTYKPEASRLIDLGPCEYACLAVGYVAVQTPVIGSNAPERECVPEPKCTGLPEDGAEPNNTETPSRDMPYFYAPNSDLPCSFKCKNSLYQYCDSDNTCKMPDHWEWKFYDENGNEITKLTATVGGLEKTSNGTNEYSMVNVDVVYFSRDGSLDSIIDKESGGYGYRDWWRVTGSYLKGSTVQLGGQIEEHNDDRGYAKGGQTATVTVDLTKFKNGIPIYNNLSYTWDGGYFGYYDRQFTNIVKLTYNSLSETKDFAHETFYQNLSNSRTLYGYLVRRHTKYTPPMSELTNSAHHNYINSVQQRTITAKSVPVYNCGNSGSGDDNGTTPGGGGGGGGGCFLSGTQVHMADGSTKNIEDVEVNDMVLTYNIDSGELENHRVFHKFVHENSDDELYQLTIDGKVLKVTEFHRFYIARKGFESANENQCANPYRWIEARYLQVGDEILMNDGSIATIENIEHHPNLSTTYNLGVEGIHNYFVDEGYLVHNAAKEKAINDDDIVNPGDHSDCGWDQERARSYCSDGVRYNGEGKRCCG